MIAPDPQWAQFHIAMAKCQLREVADWNEFGLRFRSTITNGADTAQTFLSGGIQPDQPFPLARQWIYPTNKLVNRVND
jgi:hypothetical protein